MTSKAVLLDTNFFIHLLKEDSKLYKIANEYFKYFCEQNMKMKISTISIAEYCVIGSLDQLPLKNIQIVPFNIDHATKAGEFAKYVFESRNLIAVERTIIPNDTKLFAQAYVDNSVSFYLSSDTKSKKIYDLLIKKGDIGFKFLDLHNTYLESFGKLF
ncbi:MAG: hypothetical protein K0R14_634 [Burkholderiales bacterium]|jgi:predicted nucleic acid-binding protein|nr:hypothetical protein [Burkholderiales bacterium]